MSSAIQSGGSPKMTGDRLPAKTSARRPLALQRLAIHLRHRQRAGVELRRDVQLVEGALPLASDAQQLEEEDAELGVGRIMADLILQRLERRIGVAAAHGLLGEWPGTSRRVDLGHRRNHLPSA